MTPDHLDVLRRLIDKLDAGLRPANTDLGRIPQVSPSGIELTEAQALDYRVVEFKGGAEVWLEMARPASWLPNFERIPMWARVSVFAVCVGFPVANVLGVLMGLILLCKL